MKSVVVALAAIVTSVIAQNSTSYVYEYYNTCTSSSGGIATATKSIDSCHVCEEAGFTSYPGGSLTTYVTEYSEVCPTGLEAKTYTVTEPCPSTGLPREAPTYIPQGFTTTSATVPCHVCEGGSSVAPITTPGPALVSALAAAPPTPNAKVAAAASPPAAAPAAPVAEEGAAESPAGAAAPAANGAAAPPGTLGVAGAPAAPGAPDVAGAPAAPAAPGVAGAPVAPGAPGVAAAPGAPGDAASPGVADAPGIAGAAAAPGAPYAILSGAEEGFASPSSASVSNSTVPFTGDAAHAVSMMSSLGLLTAAFAFAFAL